MACMTTREPLLAKRAWLGNPWCFTTPRLLTPSPLVLRVTGVLDNCTPRADPTVTVVAAVVGTVAALALVAALATFVYRRKTRGAYARLSA